MREICVVCNLKNNTEEGTECKICKHWVCFECVVFEDGSYFCVNCIDSKNNNT